MKHSILRKLMLIAVLLTSSHAFAYDFEVDGIYYNIISEASLNAEVTRGDYFYSGKISIPSRVTYDNTTYSVTKITSYAFKDCRDLASITIPSSITSIETSTFRFCSSLTSVSLPYTLTHIGSNAFYGCSSLASITIPSSVESIGSGAFLYTGWYDNQVDGVLYLNNCCLGYKGNLSGDLSLSYGTRLIADKALSNSELTSATIPSTVKTIGEYAFCDNRNLTSVTIPNSVTNIGISTFENCTNLCDLTLGNSVTTIGERAFANCFELTSLTIPSSVTSIGRDAFAPMPKVNSIIVESGNTIYDSRGNCNAIIETATNNLVVGCSATTIPNSVKSIESGAFTLYLASILTIPSSVTNINLGAFQVCPALTTIIVEEGNPIYNSRNNCNAIIETATNTLIKGCNNTIIPNSVTYIGKIAFLNCEGLTSIAIPNSVTSIGRSAFEGCSGLTNITIPNSVTSIGDYAFNNCSGLTSIVLGKSIASIGYNAFYMSTKIIEIESLNPTAPNISYSFDYSLYDKAKVRVPVGALESYQNAEGWKDFKNIISNLGYKIFTNYNNSEGNITINGVNERYLGVEIESPVEFIITPNAGYMIDKVSLNGKDITSNVVNGKYNVEKIIEDLSLSVIFKKICYSLILKCSEAGAFKRIMNYGETATHEIVPSENWEINTVTFNGIDVTNEIVDNTFTTPAITEDSELSVVFVDVPTSVYSLYDTKDVKVYASQQTVKINGLEENMPVTVYDTSGHMEYNSVSTDSEMNINMNKSGAYLVKVGERTFKVIL